MNKNEIKKFVEANPSLVAKRATQKQGIWVLKYKNRVFYKNLWTPELLECRGTLVDDEYNIIQRPFTKIFNRGENGMDIPRDELVYAVEKINGFMAAATWHNNELLVSTTGSIDSEFADTAKKWLDKEEYYSIFKEYENYTFIFEIVDENDPHIVVEVPGVYLLGMRLKDWNSCNHAIEEYKLDIIAKDVGWKRPMWDVIRFSDLVKKVKTVKHEGYVCYNDKYELKIKSPFYLVTKFFGRMNDKRFEEMLNNPTSAKTRIDEEFYDVIDYLSENKDVFLNFGQQDRIKFVREFIED